MFICSFLLMVFSHLISSTDFCFPTLQVTCFSPDFWLLTPPTLHALAPVRTILPINPGVLPSNCDTSNVNPFANQYFGSRPLPYPPSLSPVFAIHPHGTVEYENSTNTRSQCRRPLGYMPAEWIDQEGGQCLQHSRSHSRFGS